MDVTKLQAYKRPTSIQEAAQMIGDLEKEIKAHTRTAYRLGMDVIRKRFEQGRGVEEAYVLNATSLNGETVTTYGTGLVDALAQKADVSPKVLRECHALFKRAKTRERFYEQLGRWEDQNIKISWNLCVNWAKKALPPGEEEAQDKVDKEIASIERTIIKAKDRLLDLKEQIEELPARKDELLGVAQELVETIEEVQTARIELSGVALDRPTRTMDERYLAFIRSQPCQNCGGAAPSEPHHVDRGGVGTKGSDYYCIPVCAACHREIHDVGKATFWGDYNVWEAVARTLSRYLEKR